MPYCIIHANSYLTSQFLPLFWRCYHTNYGKSPSLMSPNTDQLKLSGEGPATGLASGTHDRHSHPLMALCSEGPCVWFLCSVWPSHSCTNFWSQAFVFLFLTVYLNLGSCLWASAHHSAETQAWNFSFRDRSLNYASFLLSLFLRFTLTISKLFLNISQYLVIRY